VTFDLLNTSLIQNLNRWKALLIVREQLLGLSTFLLESPIDIVLFIIIFFPPKKKITP
jgi:hypothetical protein